MQLRPDASLQIRNSQTPPKTPGTHDYTVPPCPKSRTPASLAQRQNFNRRRQISKFTQIALNATRQISHFRTSTVAMQIISKPAPSPWTANSDLHWDQENHIFWFRQF
jgi:hypothetical protein